MRAITLWQPYASLVAIGAKRFETRSWCFPDAMAGERIAIAAAKKSPAAVIRDLPHSLVLQMREAFKAAGLHEFRMGFDDAFQSLPRGAVVCTTVLEDAYPTEEITPCGNCGEMRWEYNHLDLDPFGDYSPDRWAWALKDTQRLEIPVPAKGRQGWWEVELP